MNHFLNRRRGFSLVELTTAFLVVTVLLALVAPAMQRARDDARRQACMNHLKQIGLAFHNYHDAHKCMPPGWTNHHPEPGEQERYGWGMFLTPFLDSIEIYEQVAFSNQEPRALAVTRQRLPVYRCPSDTTEDPNLLRGGFGTSNYSANFGSTAPPRWLDVTLCSAWPGQASTPPQTNGMLWYNSCCRFRDVTDGTSNTLLAGERSISGAAGLWMGVRGNNYESDQVTDTSAGNEINSSETSFSSSHSGGAAFLFGDGRVLFLNEKIDSTPRSDGRPGTYQRLGNRHDNLPVDEF